MSPLLELRDLTVGHGPVTALYGVSIRVSPGEVVALAGANGAGKSTLLRAVIGAVPVIAGDVAFDGRALAGQPVWARARSGIGYCPEGRRVFPGLTVDENLDVASRHPRASTAERMAEIHRLFPALVQRRATLGWQLSGGEQQMLAIGRALMMRPKLLLLDEPSLGLSPLLTGEVLRTLREIAAGGTSVLLAEQNAAQALAVADRAYVLRLGRIVDEGPAAEPRLRRSVETAFLAG
jgi:branched-chain amino acid transport system ATP-binding protein